MQKFTKNMQKLTCRTKWLSHMWKIITASVSLVSASFFHIWYQQNWSYIYLIHNCTTTEENSWRGSHGPFGKHYKHFQMIHLIYVALWILRNFKLGSLSIFCLIITLSFTAVIWVFSGLIVRNTFLQVKHFIWSF